MRFDAITMTTTKVAKCVSHQFSLIILKYSSLNGNVNEHWAVIFISHFGKCDIFHLTFLIFLIVKRKREREKNGRLCYRLEACLVLECSMFSVQCSVVRRGKSDEVIDRIEDTNALKTKNEIKRIKRATLSTKYNEHGWRDTSIKTNGNKQSQIITNFFWRNIRNHLKLNSKKGERGREEKN